jgi:hypothetical protein
VLITCLPDRHVLDQVVISARVEWEDCDRKNRVVYACVPAEHAGTAARGEWLLLSTAFIAARYGERRVKVDVPVDPMLCRGLGCSLQQLHLWYGAAGVAIEAPTTGRPPTAEPGARSAGLLVSGGVDSWSSFLRNRAEIGTGHPLSFTTGLKVDWMGPSDVDELDEVLRVADRGWQSSGSGRAFAAGGLDVVTVVTNARRLDGNVFHWDWMFSDHGAMFSAIAHLLTGRLWSASIASTYDLRGLGPWGSHPMLDPWYGSTGLRILHDSPDLSRMAKLGLLVDRRDVLAVLDVCSYWFQRADEAASNCGRCEKCLRTLTGLAAAGVEIAGLPNFDPVDIVEELRGIEHFQDDYERACWADILAGLDAVGHPLLAPVQDLMQRASVRNPFVGQGVGDAGTGE